MAGWHHWLNGRESQWTPGVGDGQGGLACCDSCSCKESDTTERLIWSHLTTVKLRHSVHQKTSWRKCKGGGASLVAQWVVRNLPAMQETWVRSLGWEEPLEKGKTTHPSILVWRISRINHYLPTPVFWPGEFHGLYSPWGHKGSDMTECLSLHFIHYLSMENPMDKSLRWR